MGVFSTVLKIDSVTHKLVETQTYLSSSSSRAILSKCRWSLCPSLASINQWQLRLFPLLWLLTDGGGGDSIRPTVALRIHPPQDTAKVKKYPTYYFPKPTTLTNTLSLKTSHHRNCSFTSNLNRLTDRHIVAQECSSVVVSC